MEIGSPLPGKLVSFLQKGIEQMFIHDFPHLVQLVDSLVFFWEDAGVGLRSGERGNTKDYFWGVGGRRFVTYSM